MVALRASPKKIYPLFLFAALRSELVQQRIKALNVDAVIPHLKKTDFDKLFIPRPDELTQHWIGDWHFQICSRIEQLCETNKTLESIAQAIFKSWFVDFDPVHAKAKGLAPEGIDEATAALFPDSYEETELGMVPKGWSVSNIGMIADVIDCLHSKKPEFQVSGFPYLQLNNIRSDGLLDTSSIAFINAKDYEKWTSRIEVQKGDCVITNVGRVGAVSQIPAGFKAAIGRNMTAIRSKKTANYPTFLIQLLMSEAMRKEIVRNTDEGTILSALNVKSIPKLRFVAPNNAIFSVYEVIARPLQEQMERNNLFSQVLANTRDTLLPRLISGQLRIEEAKEIAESV
jgi:type I restriction enzyme S subunit